MEPDSILSFLTAITLERIYGWFTFGITAGIALGGLILVHEYGHFIVARILGVRVEKFSIGFGPRIKSFTWGETEYMLSWIPLGGYVKFFGDDPDSDDGDDAESFLNQPVKKRLAIVAAGPVFNLILAVFIVSAAAMIGIPEGTKIINEVVEGKPAAAAGIKVGDTIDTINSKAMENWGSVVEAIRAAPETEIVIGVIRESGEHVDIKITPIAHEAQTIEGKTVTIGQIGVAPREVLHSYPPHEAVMRGVEWTWRLTTLTLWSVTKLISRDIPADQIAGPIGIMQMAGQVAANGFVNLMMFIALISVNLGILNLLPIPVLDGGHLVFFSVEAVLGRPIKMKTQEMAQQVGIFLLLSLMAFAFYNDIVRLSG